MNDVDVELTKRMLGLLECGGSDQALDLKSEHFERIKTSLARFDDYLPFVSENGPSEEVQTSADRIQGDVRDIYNILIEAERAVAAKTQQLKDHVAHFTLTVAAHSDPHWYRKLDDITAYNDTKLVQLISKMPIPDVADFAAYLKDILPAAAKKPRPDHEYSGRTFTGKLHLLLEKVLHESSTDLSIPFSLFIHVKARVLLHDRPRVHEKYLVNEAEYVNETLLWLLQEHESSPTRYWNFAAAWRELVYFGDDVSCYGSIVFLMKLLDSLRRMAEAEIRARVYLAAKKHLPVELAESIVERAMLVEEIPCE